MSNKKSKANAENTTTNTTTNTQPTTEGPYCNLQPEGDYSLLNASLDPSLASLTVSIEKAFGAICQTWADVALTIYKASTLCKSFGVFCSRLKERELLGKGYSINSPRELKNIIEIGRQLDGTRPKFPVKLLEILGIQLLHAALKHPGVLELIKRQVAHSERTPTQMRVLADRWIKEAKQQLKAEKAKPPNKAEAKEKSKVPKTAEELLGLIKASLKQIRIEDTFDVDMLEEAMDLLDKAISAANERIAAAA